VARTPDLISPAVGGAVGVGVGVGGGAGVR
jgi:hypothetical protein